VNTGHPTQTENFYSSTNLCLHNETILSHSISYAYIFYPDRTWCLFTQIFIEAYNLLGFRDRTAQDEHLALLDLLVVAFLPTQT
jgi:hypothetical protein